MKKLVILGAGTAGTIMANKLAAALDGNEWQITIVDKDETHYYQPGFLFIPFGIYSRADAIKPKRDYLPPQVNLIMSNIEMIEPEKSRVKLESGAILPYDFLVIATGSRINPDETPGLRNGAWHKIFLIFIPSKARLAWRIS